MAEFFYGYLGVIYFAVNYSQDDFEVIL